MARAYHLVQPPAEGSGELVERDRAGAIHVALVEEVIDVAVI